MASTQAKAWTYESTKGGMIANLRLTDIKIPDLKPDHVLIEVLNASLNPGDYKFPDLPLVRWLSKRPVAAGFDFCGRIRALPHDFTNDSRNLRVDQVVFGVHQAFQSLGSLRTIMVVHKDTLYPLPDNVPMEHGSAFGAAAVTAYQAIVPYAKPGGKILINGGSGGVGTFCIQIAKSQGLYVIATCSQAGAQLCKDLGADEIIDYKAPTFHQDLTRTPVDIVVDNVGYDPSFHRRSEAFLRPDGQFCLVGLMTHSWEGIGSMLVSLFCPTWLGGPSRKWKGIFMDCSLTSYQAVAALAHEGKLRVAVESVFAFKNVPEAYEKLKSGRVKGKIIVDVSAHDLS